MIHCTTAHCDSSTKPVYMFGWPYVRNQISSLRESCLRDVSTAWAGRRHGTGHLITMRYREKGEYSGRRLIVRDACRQYGSTLVEG